MMKLYLISIVF